jgi:hypothetical protein
MPETEEPRTCSKCGILYTSFNREFYGEPPVTAEEARALNRRYLRHLAYATPLAIAAIVMGIFAALEHGNALANVLNVGWVLCAIAFVFTIIGIADSQ